MPTRILPSLVGESKRAEPEVCNQCQRLREYSKGSSMLLTCAFVEDEVDRAAEIDVDKVDGRALASDRLRGRNELDRLENERRGVSHRCC